MHIDVQSNIYFGYKTVTVSSKKHPWKRQAVENILRKRSLSYTVKPGRDITGVDMAW